MKQGNPHKKLFVDIRTRAEIMCAGMAGTADFTVPFLDFPEV